MKQLSVSSRYAKVLEEYTIFKEYEFIWYVWITKYVHLEYELF